ncbi:hypothetical protein C900_04742 [Fulvivirga imtechensis AK7]|uniref:Uncharacterized protein n=1 Tax=Fulvivirga imtechensis AK7 TaxID=1237149 RepID=L8JW15_9BACT|nr:hypothetical protein C900_04742 [Fulvivirga imtechensis AK7]
MCIDAFPHMKSEWATRVCIDYWDMALNLVFNFCMLQPETKL